MLSNIDQRPDYRIANAAARWQVGWVDCAVNCVWTVCAEIRMDPDSKYILRKVVLDFICLFIGMELLISICNC